MRPLARIGLVSAWFGVAIQCVAGLSAAEPGDLRPTMSQFIGVNGHTIQFKPELYAKVCQKVRDYHSFEWDMGNDTDFVPRFPEARNRVNWDLVYGSWLKSGFETDVCVMFNNTPPDSWKNLAVDARAYGIAFATAFGPSSAKKVVSSVEIGNEPGDYSDEKYRALVAAMAEGFRQGDPKLKIVTCNMTAGNSGKYEKSVTCVAGLESLYDVLAIHTYALADGWPAWRRSYPEDLKTEFVKSVAALVAWRDAHANGKEVWVTEFGWDASTKPRYTTGDNAKWEGNVSDEKQAQYLVRAFLLFASMDVNRAYLYFFNDSNEPSFHAASGITRNFEPKSSFHALGHLYRTLGDYRFNRAVSTKEGQEYLYKFVHANDAAKSVYVAWSPTGSGRSTEIEIQLGSTRVVRLEKMPLLPGPAPNVPHLSRNDSIRFTIDESPVYVFVAD